MTWYLLLREHSKVLEVLGTMVATSPFRCLSPDADEGILPSIGAISGKETENVVRK